MRLSLKVFFGDRSSQHAVYVRGAGIDTPRVRTFDVLWHVHSLFPSHPDEKVEVMVGSFPLGYVSLKSGQPEPQTFTEWTPTPSRDSLTVFVQPRSTDAIEFTGLTEDARRLVQSRIKKQQGLVAPAAFAAPKKRCCSLGELRRRVAQVDAWR